MKISSHENFIKVRAFFDEKIDIARAEKEILLA
jgi:hypothetical protein